jgi:hypothetical protein
MPQLTMKEIRDEAVALLTKNPGGMRFKEIVRAIDQSHPGNNQYNSIFTQVSELHKSLKGKVVKPTRGLYQLATSADREEEVSPKLCVGEVIEVVKFKEHQFYDAFANFLKTDLDEATEAESLGGAGLKGKWGTPDVVGVYKPQAADFVKFPIELVSAELKIDAQQPVVAFGQAVAYRLFSHRVYIGMPATLTETDLARLESLCMLFGIGLVLFDLNLDKPNFVIRMRAQRFIPDMFYVNQFAGRMLEHDPATFQKLFG